MPVCIPDALPAAKVLASENIFVMTRQRSTHQDIRPLHIAVLNLCLLYTSRGTRASTWATARS